MQYSPNWQKLTAVLSTGAAIVFVMLIVLKMLAATNANVGMVYMRY